MASFHPLRILRSTLAVSALFWCIQPIAQAEIYRWVDENGTVHFSDQSKPGAKQIEVAPVSTISLPRLDATASTPKPEEPVELGYERVEISFPGDNSAFHSGNGTFTVTTFVEPPLRPSHDLRLVFDGQVYAEGRNGTFLMENVDRGTHTLVLQVVDNGEVIHSSPGVTFTVHRPSLLNPNRPKAPSKPAP